MEKIGELEVDLDSLDATLALTLLPGSFTVPWSQCGATADFLAAYAAGLTADRGGPSAGELSSVVNELLENAIKFGYLGPIEVTIGTLGGDVCCRLENPVEADRDELREKLLALIAADPTEALVARVEENALREDSDAGIGLLGLRSDYGVELSFALREDPRPGLVIVETTARMRGSEA